MSVKKKYIEVVNQWLNDNYLENDMELLMSIEGMENIESRKIELIDTFYRKLRTSDNSRMSEEFLSLTHIFNFNEESIQIECLADEFNYEIFNEIYYNIFYSFELHIELVDEEAEIDTSLVLINILNDIDLPDFWENELPSFHEKMLDEIKMERLIKLEDAQLIFPNVIKVEAVSLDITNFYIADDIHFPFNNESLKYAIKILKEELV